MQNNPFAIGFYRVIGNFVFIVHFYGVIPLNCVFVPALSYKDGFALQLTRQSESLVDQSVSYYPFFSLPFCLAFLLAQTTSHILLESR